MGLFFLSMEGIIHRDLKEENIMIDRKNRGRIIDFGSVTGAVGASRFKPIDNKCMYMLIQVVLLRDIFFLMKNLFKWFHLSQIDSIEVNSTITKILISTVLVRFFIRSSILTKLLRKITF